MQGRKRKKVSSVIKYIDKMQSQICEGADENPRIICFGYSNSSCKSNVSGVLYKFRSICQLRGALKWIS